MVAFAQATRDELQEISSYVAALNGQREHLVAWLGQHEDEVFKELESLPYVPFEESFVTARVDERLVGVMGMYAFPEKGMFRLLGPYVTEGDWQETAESLWTELLPLVPAVCKECRAAIDEANVEMMRFLDRHGFAEYNAEASMVLRKERYAPFELPDAPNVVVEAYTPAYEKRFREIHNNDTYFTAQELLDKLGDNMHMWIVRDGNVMKGYVCIETFPTTTKRADVLFIAVAPAERGKGYGSYAFRHMIERVFQQEDLDAIELSVRTTNPAKRLYERFGFEYQFVIHALKKEFE